MLMIDRAFNYVWRFLREGRRDAQKQSGPALFIAETTRVEPRRSDFSKQRLNLLLPSINAEHYFGGIHTAVQMFTAIGANFGACRIVLMDATPDQKALLKFERFTSVASDLDSDDSFQIVPFADRYGKTLPVAEGDCWMATAWWTAYAAQRLSAWQKGAYGSCGKLAYMIQDFEPGFYPWSSQYLLALATYRPSRDIGIFNTELLLNYFRSQGCEFKEHLVFEPALNEGLRGRLNDVRKTRVPRSRRLVIYARPSTPRNAFALICESLRAWAWSYHDTHQWEVVAAGELAEDIDLGPIRVRALGKLAIDDYAEILATSAVGLSLMVSPHPSYPPLEMAAFGMEVVTNRFANKDLSSFSPNIRVVQDVNPESIAEALIAACESYSSHNMASAWVMPASHEFLRDLMFEDIGRAAAQLLIARDATTGD